MTIHAEVNVLRGFPPGNMNRDDLGTPKTAVFCGALRLRISSQCLKRTWRTSEPFRGAFAEDQLGIRTNRLPEEVLKEIGQSLDAASQAGLLALLGSIGKGTKKPKLERDDEDAGDGKEQATDTATETRTAHLLFLSRQEIEAVGSFTTAKAKQEVLARVLKKGKVDSQVISKLRDELQEHLVAKTSRNAIDVGLFGRFVTSPEFDTIEGALQVAHAIGTQKVEIERDFFTAVDDLSDEPGAGHLGETEFASSVMYMFCSCDLGQLEENLGARTKTGRTPDGDARALARKALPALVRAMAESTPRGKRTGTAPHTPAEYVEVVVRRGAPLSLANAFAKPVDGREANGDVMAASIMRLEKHRDRIETAYGRDKDVIARFVLCLRDTEDSAPKTNRVDTMAQLAERLAGVLAKLPAQVRE